MSNWDATVSRHVLRCLVFRYCLGWQTPSAAIKYGCIRGKVCEAKGVVAAIHLVDILLLNRRRTWA